MTAPAPAAPTVRERLDLAAGLLAQAVKLITIKQAQPAAALAAVLMATDLLDSVAGEAGGTSR